MAQVNGRTFDVDAKKFQSWAVFELIGAINDEGKTPYERTNAMFAIVETCTDLTKADVIEMAGGADADVKAVFDTLAAIIAEAAPKN